MLNATNPGSLDDAKGLSARRRDGGHHLREPPLERVGKAASVEKGRRAWSEVLSTTKYSYSVIDAKARPPRHTSGSGSIQARVQREGTWGGILKREGQTGFIHTLHSYGSNQSCMLAKATPLAKNERWVIRRTRSTSYEVRVMHRLIVDQPGIINMTRWQRGPQAKLSKPR